MLSLANTYLSRGDIFLSAVLISDVQATVLVSPKHCGRSFLTSSYYVYLLAYPQQAFSVFWVKAVFFKAVIKTHEIVYYLCGYPVSHITFSFVKYRPCDISYRLRKTAYEIPRSLSGEFL